MDYEKDFHDPVVRCEQCNSLTHRKYIYKNGGCAKCGNKRFKSIHALDGDEVSGLKDGTLKIGIRGYKIDPEFLALFEAVEEVSE